MNAAAQNFAMSGVGDQAGRTGYVTVGPGIFYSAYTVNTSGHAVYLWIFDGGDPAGSSGELRGVVPVGNGANGGLDIGAGTRFRKGITVSVSSDAAEYIPDPTCAVCLHYTKVS